MHRFGRIWLGCSIVADAPHGGGTLIQILIVWFQRRDEQTVGDAI